MLGAVAALAIGAAPASAAFTPGAAGVGDPFFPRAGNGGYDVSHYDIDLNYIPANNHLVATTTIRATATNDLSAFDLDYRGPRITGLTVGGIPVPFDRHGQELVVTPPAGIRNGAVFTVKVDYRGTPRSITDPDGSIEGWVRTSDGAFVVGEPQGSPTWFPCNDHPTDKATFEISITVPQGTQAISNGALRARTPSKRKHARRHRHRRHRHKAAATVTWNYGSSQPMATYLATATVGDFTIDRSRVAGLGSVVAVDPTEARPALASQTLDQIGPIITLFDGLFGPYPFNQTGAIVDHAPTVGYALETQTRPIFDRAPDEITLSHEIAHQWFGDSVSLERWQDMWLNEGFATWAEWRWTEAHGGRTTAEQFESLLAEPAKSTIWRPPRT